MANIIETCRHCGGRNLEWQHDNRWVTGTWRWLRCRECGEGLRLKVPAWTWVLYAIAAAAAIWVWIVIA